MILICVVVLAFMFRLAQYKGIPNSLIWVAVIIAIYTYIASKTTTGRYFYAVGGNEKATKLSGINTNKVYFLAYLNMGLLAAIAGMVTMAISQYVLREYQKLSGNFVPKNIHKFCRYFNLQPENPELVKTITKQKSKCICINDSNFEIPYEKVKQELNHAFSILFPEKSQFEKKKTVFLFVHVTDYKATCILIKIVIFTSDLLTCV